MDLNTILLWTAAVSGVATIATALRTRMRGWIAVGALLLAACGVAWLVAAGAAGYVAAAVWFVLVLLPGLASRRLLRLAYEEKFAAAARLASLLRILHPGDGWREQPRWLYALEAARAGRNDEAAALLRTVRGHLARQAAVYLQRVEGRWEELATLSDDDLRGQPGLAQLRLRALGETEGGEAVAREYARLAPRLASRAMALLAEHCHLFLFCFAGHRDGAARILAGTLRRLPDATRRFWLATADLAAGRRTEAEAELTRLTDAPNAVLRADVSRRLARGLPPPGPRAVALAETVAASLALEERHGLRAASGARSAPVTLALIAVLAAVFLVEEASGGSRDLPTLSRLGAFLPSRIADGEAWRLVTFTVLHNGLLHLVMNVLGLAVVAPPVERLLGGARLLAVYLLASVGGGALLFALTELRALHPALIVGASGGVMGLVGATATTLARGWLASGNPALRRRLALIGGMVLMQVVYDLTTPGVSFAGHAAGFVLGLLAALLLRPRRARG